MASKEVTSTPKIAVKTRTDTEGEQYKEERKGNENNQQRENEQEMKQHETMTKKIQVESLEERAKKDTMLIEDNGRLSKEDKDEKELIVRIK